MQHKWVVDKDLLMYSQKDLDWHYVQKIEEELFLYIKYKMLLTYRNDFILTFYFPVWKM